MDFLYKTVYSQVCFFYKNIKKCLIFLKIQTLNEISDCIMIFDSTV